MNNESYSRLFEIVNKNMQQSGKTFDRRKAAFFYYIKNDPYETDIMELLDADVSNEEFLDIAYISFLGRLADESAVNNYKGFFSLSKREFRLKVIRDLKNFEEVKLACKRILNYIGDTENYRSIGLLQSVMVHILPIYKKLPNGLKKCIRKILGASLE